MKSSGLGFVIGVVYLTFLSVVSAQEKASRSGAVTGHMFQPAQREFADSFVESLVLPAGFQARIFARNLGKPRMMAVAADGTVYVTRPDQNDVVALQDNNRDGRADRLFIVLRNLEKVHGIAIHRGYLYLAAPKKLYFAPLLGGGNTGEARVLVDDLPDGGQHGNRTIAFGPNGLYLSVGSTCNACNETNLENATLLRFEAGMGDRRIFARGLRNTIGFDWHPETGELWGMDHGSDWRGDDQPPEELNRLQAGKDYGWPFCYADRRIDHFVPTEPKGKTKEQYCATTEPPALTYQAHSAPIAMLFYRGAQFPQEFRGDALVAMHGSWNRKQPTGYKVARVRFKEGRPVQFEDFLSGFLSPEGENYFGRPAGLATARDGSLLVSDDANGIIYTVSYDKAVTAK
jgi:glucose/arabinose dehydrogenase